MNVSRRNQNGGSSRKNKKTGDNTGILSVFSESFENQLPIFKKLGSREKFVVLDFPTTCRNYCVFCAHKGKSGGKFSFSKLAKIVDSNKKLGIKQLILVANDPLLHPKILDILACAKKAGFSEIETISSGENFAVASFVRKASAKGLTAVSIPIYGLGKIHDLIVGSRGSFERGRQGIKNLEKEKIGLYLHSLLLRKNIDFQKDINDFCQSHTNSLPAILHLKYKKRLQYKKLMPSYKEIVKKFRNSDLNFIGYPLCILEKISPANFSQAVDSQRNYEKQPLLKIEKNVADSIILYSRVFDYRRAPQCHDCELRKPCPGIPSGYLENYGGEQIKPF